MNSPKSRSSSGKARPRQVKKTFDLARFLSFLLLLLVLTFSLCAVGYVIFFRTVVAGELAQTSHGAVVFEEPDPPGHREENGKMSVEDKVIETTERKDLGTVPELPKVAIIIDDMGYDEVIGEQLLTVPFELTYSFLPFAPHTRKLERLAHRAGKTVFLHLPLEPKDGTFNPGCGALYLQDSPEEQREKIAMALQEVPHAVGVNNHMGSRFTEDKPAMANIMQEIKDRSLMFVDSFTTPGSVGLQSARQAAVKSSGRSVFLDNVMDEEKICDQLEQLVKISKRNGRAIGIGHPRRETFNALLRCGEKYRGWIEYVGLREVLLPTMQVVDEFKTLKQ